MLLKLNRIFHWLVFVNATLFMGSCTVKEEVLPENVIEDNSGLDIQLEWTTGGSTTNSLDAADLELYLYKGDIKVQSSTKAASFEEVSLSGLLADGEYRVEVQLYSTTTNVNFSLYAIGQQSNTTLEYTGSFTTADVSNSATYPEFIKIKKEGTTYTIVR